MIRSFLQSVCLPVGSSPLSSSVSLFQSYPSLQDLDNIKDWTEVELDTSLSFGTITKTTTTMLEKIQQELEKLTSIGKTEITVVNFKD